MQESQGTERHSPATVILLSRSIEYEVRIGSFIGEIMFNSNSFIRWFFFCLFFYLVG